MNYDPCLAAENAVATYLKTRTFSWCPSTQIYSGIENKDTEEMEGQESSLRILPCILVKSETAKPQGDYAPGNWIPHIDVWVVSNRMQTTAADHRTRAQEVFAAICREDIEHTLNSSTFFVLRVVPTETGHTAEASVWVSYMEFDFHCCAGDNLE